MAQKGILHDLAGILQRDIIFFTPIGINMIPHQTMVKSWQNHGKTRVKSSKNFLTVSDARSRTFTASPLERRCPQRRESKLPPSSAHLSGFYNKGWLPVNFPESQVWKRNSIFSSIFSFYSL